MSSIASPTFSGPKDIKDSEGNMSAIVIGAIVLVGVVLLVIYVGMKHAPKGTPVPSQPNQIIVRVPETKVNVNMPKPGQPTQAKTTIQQPSDPVSRLPNPEPYDEQRWPRHLASGWYNGELGSYGHGQYGAGSSGYRPGMLADTIIGSGFPYGSPQDRILRRPRYAVGPWVRVGTLFSQSKDQVLPLFARNVSRHSDRYDYRTMAGSNGDVPVEVATFSQQLQENATIAVQPLGNSEYVVNYNQYAF